MTAVVVALVVVVALGMLGVWLSWTATRIDRLHHRIDVAHETLRTRLTARSAVAAELATSGVLDPASALLLAEAAGRAGLAERGEGIDAVAESELSETLRRVVAAGGLDPAVVAEIAEAGRRVELARRIHNDQVTAARALRERPLVRWLRLAGRATPPVTVDFDDEPVPHPDPAGPADGPARPPTA